MKIVLIRHGMTEGNTRGAYVGRSNEPLVKMKIDNSYPNISSLYSSPMLRCLQTASIIYPSLTAAVEDDLRECDFGDFENKTYEELKDNKEYITWCDGGGTHAFPNGESGVDFRKRCINAFEKIVSSALQDKIPSIAIICHGGTIMAVLEHFSNPKQDFYSFQVKNLCGYQFDFDCGLIYNLEKILGG